MPSKDTFFLRSNISTSGTNYVSDDIDISAYTDPARGRVLVVDRAWCTISSDSNGPVQPADVLGSAGSRSVGIQATSETQTGLVQLDNNSIFFKMNFYASLAAASIFSMIDETASMNPYETTGGFIIPTNSIHVGLDCGSAWTNELDIGFCFEVHTEKLSLQRIQELLVSLTAN